MLKLEFKIDPVPKGRPKFGRGRTYTPAKTVRFEKAIQAMARVAYRGDLIIDPVFVTVTFLIRRPKSVKRDHPCVKPDLDNLCKAVFDALNGIVWKDDGVLCGIYAKKQYTDGPGSIILEINTNY